MHDSDPVSNNRIKDPNTMFIGGTTRGRDLGVLLRGYMGDDFFLDSIEDK